MRLIDADELLKAVDKERKYLLARGQTGAEHILVHNFRDLIDNAPTVEERPTGEWKDLSDGWQEGTYECSNCKTEFVLTEGTPEDNEYHYCPNCGAKMKGEEE